MKRNIFKTEGNFEFVPTAHIKFTSFTLFFIPSIVPYHMFLALRINCVNVV